jgi:hypothetical protein
MKVSDQLHASIALSQEKRKYKSRLINIVEWWSSVSENHMIDSTLNYLEQHFEYANCIEAVDILYSRGEVYAVVWAVTPYSLVAVYRRVIASCCIPSLRCMWAAGPFETFGMNWLIVVCSGVLLCMGT